MSKLNNESYLGLRMAMALGSRYLVGEDCHWIGVTWMTREAWVKGVDWSRAAEVDVVDWGFNTFASRSIALSLYWNMTLSVTPYPWALRKFCVHMICGMTSSTLTSSTSIELLCSASDKWRCQSHSLLEGHHPTHVAKDPLIHQLIEPLSWAMRVSGKLFVPCRYFIILINFW
jgi:hypothetical protein